MGEDVKIKGFTIKYPIAGYASYYVEAVNEDEALAAYFDGEGELIEEDWYYTGQNVGPFEVTEG